MIPAPLQTAIKNGRTVLFIGAGASVDATTQHGTRGPTASTLAEEISTQFLGKPHPGTDLMRIAALASKTASPQLVYDYLRERLTALRPTVGHKLLPTFRWHTIATTNYDTLIEKAYTEHPAPLQDIVPFVKDIEPIENRKAAVARPLVLLKLHGCINHALDPDIPPILTPEHYERYSHKRERLFNRLQDVAHEMPILFIGYSLKDAHIENLIYKLDRTSTRPTYYAVSPNVSEDTRQYWRDNNVETIDCTFDVFMETLDQTMPPIWRTAQISSVTSTNPIRKHFVTNTEPSDDLSRALEVDWTYLHPNLPTDSVNAAQFYKGYDDGFGAIRQDLDIKRKAANDLIYAALDTDPNIPARLLVLRGPAGCGKSVALKRIAWTLANDFDALTLWLNETGRAKSAPLLELSRLTNKRLFVMIDKATKHVAHIRDILSSFFNQRREVTVILADRDNAWNQYSTDFEKRWNNIDFRLTKLHTDEIKDLLSKLETANALGNLKLQSPQSRITAFETAERELLVALHELTLGKPFEEIISDEYHVIFPTKAQRLYLDICTLNQLGAPVRAGLINRVSSIPFTLYKSELFSPLENVVLTQENRYTGDYEYKSRHPHISSLVFQAACPTDEDRANQIIHIVNGMDLGYNVDKDAFDQIIRARQLMDLIADVYWGRHLYDTIVDMYPDAAYIWQQRAIYELHAKGGAPELAEQYANKAKELDPSNNAISHTLAEVARVRSTVAENANQKEFFRRQARERIGLLKKSRSSFAEGTRCKLFLDEMEEARNEIDSGGDNAAEFIEAAKEAQKAIESAIHDYPDDAELHRLSARFWDILQDDGKTRRALEKAWSLKPRGSSVPIQLARVYSSEDNKRRTMEILEDALSYSPNDFALNLEMAKQLLESVDSCRRAGIYLSRSYRPADRNYEARFLHAQFLLMEGNGPLAAELFDRVAEIAPSSYIPRPHFKTTSLSRYIGRLSGTIANREETFLFVNCARYPRPIFGHISDSDAKVWKDLRPYSAATFALGFNRTGPVAVSVEPAGLSR